MVWIVYQACCSQVQTPSGPQVVVAVAQTLVVGGPADRVLGGLAEGPEEGNQASWEDL